MSSAARKMRRRVQRGFAAANIDASKADALIEAMNGIRQAKVQEVHKIAPKITDEVYEDLQEKWTPHVQAMMLMMFCAFMHDKRGYGKKRLHDLVQEFNLYADDLVLNRITNDDIMEALKEEMGFDLRAEFSEAEKHSKVEAKEYRRIHDKLKKEGRI